MDGLWAYVICFVAGLFIGALAGVLTLSLAVVAKMDREEDENEF